MVSLEKGTLPIILLSRREGNLGYHLSCATVETKSHEQGIWEGRVNCMCNVQLTPSPPRVGHMGGNSGYTNIKGVHFVRVEYKSNK